MNIVYVCADRGIPLLGTKGAAVHVRSITSAMQRRGHQVTVAVRRFDGASSPPNVTAIVTLEPDRAAAAEQLKDLIHSSGASVVVERYSLESGAARDASRDCGLPLILEVNSPLAAEASRYRGLDDPGAEHAEHETFQRADRIQVVSPALLRYVRSVAPSVPSRWIPNGVDTTSFAAALPAEVPGLGSGPVIGFIGSMKTWHGVDVLLDAFAAALPDDPRAQLLLVGSGPEEATLRHRAATLRLGNAVVFTGQVDHSQIPGLIRRIDVGVAPYRPQPDFYFWPLKVLEYLAAGVPVLYSDQGGLGDLVGPAGIGHQPGAAVDLAEQIRSVLTDRQRRATLAAHAAARVAETDWDAIAHQLLGFIQEGLYRSSERHGACS